MSSCASQDDFIYGEWIIGEREGITEVTISRDQKLTWNVRGDLYLDEVPVEIKRVEKKIVVEGRIESEDCLKLSIEPEGKNQALMYNHKCYIHENMIDEVMILRRINSHSSPISRPHKERIYLPKGYLGEFFIVYQATEDARLRVIDVDTSGIGFCAAVPQFRQLFNATREYRYQGDSTDIHIINPSNYTQKVDLNMLAMQRAQLSSKYAIVQHGFNQSPRQFWNERYKLNIAPNYNIEYLEIIELNIDTRPMK